MTKAESKKEITKLVEEINSLVKCLRVFRDRGSLGYCDGFISELASKRHRVNKLAGLKVYPNLTKL
jgi:hypothetical protein